MIQRHRKKIWGDPITNETAKVPESLMSYFVRTYQGTQRGPRKITL